MKKQLFFSLGVAVLLVSAGFVTFTEVRTDKDQVQKDVVVNEGGYSIALDKF